MNLVAMPLENLGGSVVNGHEAVHSLVWLSSWYIRYDCNILLLPCMHNFGLCLIWNNGRVLDSFAQKASLSLFDFVKLFDWSLSLQPC